MGSPFCSSKQSSSPEGRTFGTEPPSYAGYASGISCKQIHTWDLMISLGPLVRLSYGRSRVVLPTRYICYRVVEEHGPAGQ